MGKHIVIIDTDTGEMETDVTVRNGYCLQYCKNEDSGSLHTVGQITNGRYNLKQWIKNEVYHDIVWNIIKNHEDMLERINPERILFLEDMDYEPKDKQKIDWVFKLKKAPKDMAAIWGYWYVMESANYWIEKISDETLVLHLYRCLKQIDGYGGIRDYEIMDWKETYAAFGNDWAGNPSRQVANILDEDFEWDAVRKARDQISLEDIENDKNQSDTPFQVYKTNNKANPG